MFSYEDIQRYNETDLLIYKYIISNIDKVPYMTIRELASETHTSSTTVLRFCNKNNYEGYLEFKEALKEEQSLLQVSPPMADLQELASFFERVNSQAFEKKLQFAVDKIKKADFIIFLGMGSSGTLARYGARHFSNIGKFAVGLEDTYYPIDTYKYKNTVIIVLSESGETKEIVEMTKKFQQKNCCVLSITNSSRSTLAKLSDWNFSYYFERHRIHGGYNATTQVPVLFLIEALAERI